MKFNIESTTQKDIEIAIKYNATYDELIKSADIAMKIEKTVFKSRDPLWNKICMFLYSYKLGEMQGKREERAKKGGKNKNDTKRSMEIFK